MKKNEPLSLMELGVIFSSIFTERLKNILRKMFKDSYIWEEKNIGFTAVERFVEA